jgi:tetratricopeptide (TPR) repeat protein
MKVSGTGLRITTLAISIAVVTVLVYIPSLHNGFVNWDDQYYVYENTNIWKLNGESLLWMLTAYHASNWHPLTWLSHGTDYAIWGLNPLGHHLTSIVLHGLNTFLVVVVISCLVGIGGREGEEGVQGRAVMVGTVTGLLFGLHPLHVESVAWVSERKDVLYAFFYLLSILAYVRYARAEAGKRAVPYVVCLVLYVLSLMSKPMAVTLPVVLLILDVYPLGRTGLRGMVRSQWRVVVEKVPFFVLSIVSSILTVQAQEAGGALTPLQASGLWNRILVAIRSLVYYLYKIIWPHELVPFYPYPSEISLSAFPYFGSMILLIGFTALCIWFRKDQRIFSAASVYYVFTLLPVLGIIQVGGQGAADRYTYLPSLGPFLLISVAFVWVKEKINRRNLGENIHKMIFFISLMVILCILSILTIKQEAVWRDSISLWSAHLNKYTTVYKAYKSRAEAYMKIGNYHRAVEDLKRSIAIYPQYATSYTILGMAYERLGVSLQAIESYGKAIELNPQFYLAYNGRERAFQQVLKKSAEAVKSNPEDAAAYINRGTAHALMKNYQEALGDYNRAIRLNSQITAVYYNRGLVYSHMGDYQRAIKDFGTVLQNSPEDSDTYYRRGSALKELGEEEKAEKDFLTAAHLGHRGAREYLQSKGIGW